MKTVREMVHAIQVEMRNGNADLPPVRQRELLIELTALFGNCNTELRESEIDYKRVLLKCLEGEEAANRARMRAETSPQYIRFREAKDTQSLVLESIRTLKTVLKSTQDEMRHV